MPPKRKSSSRRRSSGLPAPIAALAKSAARLYRRDKMVAEIQNSANYFGGVNAAGQNYTTRYARAAAAGFGAYKIGRAINKFGRGQVGSALKGATVNALRKMSGQGLYTGMGDFEEVGIPGPSIPANELIPGKSDLAMIPSFSSSGDETGALTISHKEYIGDIYGPVAAFNVQSYPINPGLESTFPWLSQIAQNYDEYTLHQCIFTFRSTTTDIGTSTNGQCGTVVMGTNYNAAQPAWRDKVTMMEYDAVMSGKATESLLHGVECDPAKLSGSDGKYIRNSPLVGAQDVKTYDHGLFQLAICNSPVGYQNNSIGELWISYTVTLRKPKFFTARGLGISQDIYVSGNGTESATFLLGSQDRLLKAQANNINVNVDITLANTIALTFPAAYTGYLAITLLVEGTTMGSTTVGASAILGNVTYISDMYGANQTVGDSPGNQAGCSNATQVMWLGHVFVQNSTNGTENKLTLTTVPGTALPTQAQLKIQEYNSGFSYRAANIGTSDAPILTTAAGQVIVP